MRKIIAALGMIALAFTLTACAGKTDKERAYELGVRFNQVQNFGISAIEIAKPSAKVVDGIVAANDAAAPLVKDCIAQTFKIDDAQIAAGQEAADAQAGLARAACAAATGKVDELGKLVGAN